MVRATRGLLTVVGLLAAGAAAAQTPPAPPPTPQPAAPPPLPQPPGVVTSLPYPADAPPPPATLPAQLPPQLPPPLPPDVGPPPYQAPCEPCLIIPGGPKPGWFFAADVALLFPHVSNGVTGQVVFPALGFVDTIRLPSAGLDATTAPLLTVGYRLRDNLGAILLSYHNVASEGREVLGNFDPLGDGLLRSRLDLNAVTLAYATDEHPLGALWGLKWEVGARLTTIFFDSQAQGLAVGARTSNDFVGAGPMVALNLTRELPPTGLALYGRVEAAEMLGHIRQRFAEGVFDPNQPDNLLAFAGSDQGGSQAVPMLGIQAGLSWLSRPDGRLRLTAGYQFEHYWAVGKLGASHGDVLAQGLFLRAEFNY